MFPTSSSLSPAPTSILLSSFLPLFGHLVYVGFCLVDLFSFVFGNLYQCANVFQEGQKENTNKVHLSPIPLLGWFRKHRLVEKHVRFLRLVEI